MYHVSFSFLFVASNYYVSLLLFGSKTADTTTRVKSDAKIASKSFRKLPSKITND